MKKIILLIVAAIAAASYLVYAYMSGDPMFGTLAKTMDDLPRNERLGAKKNIVVLGVDGREKDDDPGRSDTLFVVMFDPKSKNVSLLSIPRDTRVRIPGNGWDKINHAYAFGGHKLTQQTTEELLGIQVNNYVMVDFSGFESLVDAIGGIDIDVEKDMYYYDDWDDFLIDLSAGPQHLDGKKAIQYVRYRDEEGDIGRIKRQQKFMMAVYEKISSAQILTKMPGLVAEIMKMVKTDLPVSDMVAMGGALHGMIREQGGLQMATVPGTPEYIDDISYWIPDITDLREQMVEMQGAQMTDRYRQGAEKMEAEYRRNLIAAQEKEKQQEVEAKLEEAEKTEKKIKEESKAKSKEKADAEKKAKSKKNKTDELGPVEPKEEKMTETPKAVKPPAKESSRSTITVKVVDCSGRGAGSDAAAKLAASGFDVVDGGTDPERDQTTVVSTTSNGRVVSKLTAVPFPHAMRILRADDAEYDAVIFIGKDYQ